MENLIKHIGKDIYITISEFKGNHYIDVRKYYEANEGEMRPTKKGISFDLVAWKEFVENISQIDEDIRKFLEE